MEIQAEPENGCECLFCLSQCHQCGSKNVVVSLYFVSEYNYSEHNNNIYMDFYGYNIDIKCRKCNSRFGDNENLEAYKPLIFAIRGTMNFPDMVHVKRKNNGEIETHHLFSYMSKCNRV